MIHRNLGFIYASTGHIEGAERELRSALEISPNDAQARQFLQVLENLKQQSR